MKHRILILGATGVFGERLVRRLTEWDGAELVLAARSREPLEALAHDVGAEARVMSRDSAVLEGQGLFAVIDCAGPFQGSDYGFARRVVAAGAHYIDIADGRDFVAGFRSALDAEAHRAGVAAITGASSTPALSHAALDVLTESWTRIDAVSAAISPGARAPKGLAVVHAILSWAGQPVPVFRRGGWKTQAGWSGLRREDFPGLGRRWLALADTPDLDLLVARYRPAREAMFMAGLAAPLLHLGLWLATWPVRIGLLKSLAPLARPIQVAARLGSVVGSDRGGMIAWAEGRDTAGNTVRARWSLAAPGGEGPHVPTLAAQALLRSLLDGRLAPGAGVAAGAVGLDAILAEAKGLALETSTAQSWPRDARLFARLLGPAFNELAPAVRAVHGAVGAWQGRAQARGAGGPALLIRRLAGLQTGRFDHFSVAITPVKGGEAWRRQFGRSAFRSVLRDRAEVGVFEETLGLLSFSLRARPRNGGFDWLPIGWRFGPMPLPTALMPRIAARSFARGDVYRFRVRISHPWFGLIIAYAGSLQTPVDVGSP